jgi:hypothetical protein
VEILNPTPVAAYIVLPEAYPPHTVLLPKPFVVVLFVKFAPPSVEILKPAPVVAAYKVLPEEKTPVKVLLPKPFSVVLFVKLAPPSVEILNPPDVAAYIVLPEA